MTGKSVGRLHLLVIIIIINNELQPYLMLFCVGEYEKYQKLVCKIIDALTILKILYIRFQRYIILRRKSLLVFKQE